MAKSKKVMHGGRREGAGRKATLEKPSPVLVRLEKRQLDALDRFGKERKLPNRSTSLRTIVDEATKPSEESDNDGSKERV